MEKTIKEKSEKDPEAVKIGARLRQFIEKYYGTQKKFAQQCKMNLSVLNEYITGERLITMKAINRLNKYSSISRDYLLYGKLPMLKEGHIIITSETMTNPPETAEESQAQALLAKMLHNIFVEKKSDNSQIQSETTKSDSGKISYDIIETRGKRCCITSQGTVNIVDKTILGLEDARLVSIQSQEFVDKYKHIYPLNLNCILVLDGNHTYCDDVLVGLENELYLANYDMGDEDGNYFVFTDLSDNNEMIICDPNEVEIYGAHYSTIVKGRLK